MPRIIKKNPHPAAPVNLRVIGVGGNSVLLDWDDSPETNVAYYKVWRSTSFNGTYTLVGNNVIPSTYNATGLSSGITYFFKVTVVTANNFESGYSNTVSQLTTDVIAPAVPVGIATSNFTTSSILLSWTPNVEGDMNHYNIYRSIDNLNFSQPSPLSPQVYGVSAVVDSGLASGTTYFYKMTSVDNSGNESGFSNTVNGVTLSLGTIYVDTNNPTNGDGSTGNPFKTITLAVNAANPGSTIIVRPGTYAENVQVNKALTITGGGDGVSNFPAIVTGSSTRNNCFLITAGGVLIDGFKVTLSVVQGIYVRGPNINGVEIKNCWTDNTGSSGIGAWGVQFGTDPVPSNWHGIQNLLVHHNIITKACNTLVGQGFNEHISFANGIFNFDLHHNLVGPSLNDAGYAGGVNGGEGIDIKEGCEIDAAHQALGWGVHHNRLTGLPRNPIYLDAGRSNTSTGGYTRPGFVKGIHVYNNLVYANTGHGITVTSEADLATSAVGTNGRIGGQIDDVWVDYNTIYGNSATGVLVYDRALLTISGWTTANVPLANNVQVKNNICHGNNLVANLGYTGIRHAHAWVTNSQIVKNVSTGNGGGVIVFSGTPTNTGNINLDPLFLDQANSDFTLRSLSPALDVGGDALYNPSTDYLDVATPAGRDIGALERVETTLIIPATFSGTIGTPLDFDLYAAVERSLPNGATYTGLVWDPTSTALPSGWTVET
jgi:hypothetical protein